VTTCRECERLRARVASLEAANAKLRTVAGKLGRPAARAKSEDAKGQYTPHGARCRCLACRTAS